MQRNVCAEKHSVCEPEGVIMIRVDKTMEIETDLTCVSWFAQDLDTIRLIITR